MRIYLLERLDYVKYDQFGAMVVYAKSPKRALIVAKEKCGNLGVWTEDENIKVTYLGPASYLQKTEQFILGDFNAG